MAVFVFIIIRGYRTKWIKYVYLANIIGILIFNLKPCRALIQKVFYFHREEYYKVSHTLCPVSNYKVSVQGIPDINQRLFVDVSTSSPTNLTFTVSAQFENDFMIE